MSGRTFISFSRGARERGGMLFSFSPLAGNM